jgi:hypothetical protein
MLAGKEQELFRSFEFAEITDVLTVDPNAGSVLDFGGADEFNFSQHLVLGVKGWKKKCRNQENERTQDNGDLTKGIHGKFLPFEIIHGHKRLAKRPLSGGIRVANAT